MFEWDSQFFPRSLKDVRRNVMYLSLNFVSSLNVISLCKDFSTSSTIVTNQRRDVGCADSRNSRREHKFGFLIFTKSPIVGLCKLFGGVLSDIFRAARSKRRDLRESARLPCSKDGFHFSIFLRKYDRVIMRPHGPITVFPDKVIAKLTGFPKCSAYKSLCF